MTSGIYAITHTGSGKRYVGSSKQIEIRWKQHRENLDRGLHPNSHLQHAWNKYGEGDFVFSILEEIDAESLLDREQAYLEPGEGLYNIARRADRPPVGRAWDESRRESTIQSQRRSWTPRRRAALSRRMKEYWTPDRREKQSRLRREGVDTWDEGRIAASRETRRRRRGADLSKDETVEESRDRR